MGLKQSIKNLFFIKEIDTHASYEEVVKHTRFQIINFILLTVFLSFIPVFFININNHGETLELVTNSGLILVAFLFLVFLRTSKNIEVSTYILYILFLLYVPIRVYFSGGLHSPFKPLYITHCLITFYLLGKKAGFLTVFWSLFSIISFSNIEAPSSLTLTNPTLLTINSVLLVVSSVMPSYFILYRNANFPLKLRELDKIESEEVIMKRLGGEVGDALNIALGYLKVAQEDPKKDFCSKKVEERLKDIHNLVQSMSELNYTHELVEKLKEYDAEIKLSEKFQSQEKDKSN